jgi:hypothetical protein
VRKLLAILCLAGAMFCCLAGCSEYDNGHRRGRQAARKLRGDWGEVGAAAAGAGMSLMPGKVDRSKSDEWNAGFRDGFHAEAVR